jgi:hypothetical protein
MFFSSKIVLSRRNPKAKKSDDTCDEDCLLLLTDKYVYFFSLITRSLLNHFDLSLVKSLFVTTHTSLDACIKLVRKITNKPDEQYLSF